MCIFEHLKLPNCPIVNGEFTAIVKIDGGKDDEFSWKIRSNRHSDSAAKEGQCYSFGIDFSGEPHLSKETPAHPTTPNFDNKVVIAKGMPKIFGNIRNKPIGIKGIVYNCDYYIHTNS